MPVVMRCRCKPPWSSGNQDGGYSMDISVLGMLAWSEVINSEKLCLAQKECVSSPSLHLCKINKKPE